MNVKGPVKTNKCNKKHKCDYQIYKVQTPRGSSEHRTRSLRTAGYRGDMADENRKSDAVLSKENQDIGRRPAIQQQTLYFFNCKYAIDLPSLTLQQMYWSRAEALGDVIGLATVVTTSLVMGENMELDTEKVVPDNLPGLTLQRMYWSGAESLGEVIGLATVVTTSHVMGENMEMETVQKRSIHPGHHILGHHTAPLHQVLHLVDQNTH